MTPRELVPLAADWGAILLVSGAEVRQVEEGLYGLFTAHGLRAEVFVLLKGIFLSAWEPGGEPVSLIRHVRGPGGVDLARLERALDLGPRLTAAEADPGALRAAVDELQRPPKPHWWLLPAAAGATAGVYGLFFGGSPVEALWALVTAALVQALRGPVQKLGMPSLAEVFAAAALVSLGSLAAPLVLPGADPVRIVTGGVMILIPGVALMNGIKDALHGDTVSGLYRLADAGLQTAAIAGATALILSWGVPHG